MKKNDGPCPPLPPGIKIINGKTLNIPCPLCGGRMVLRDSRFGRFYACEHWAQTKCEGLIGCHPGTNVPLGFPADLATRTLRHQAHLAFDEHWKKMKVSRRNAYRLLRQVMGLTPEQAHIGQFTKEQCQRLLQIIGDGRFTITHEMVKGNGRNQWPFSV